MELSLSFSPYKHDKAMETIPSPKNDGGNMVYFFTESKLLIANGFNRLVIGERGPYVEFLPSQIIWENAFVPSDEIWRLLHAECYYIEFRSKCKSHVKIYFQKKQVTYADYKIGLIYISPDDLVPDDENKKQITLQSR